MKNNVSSTRKISSTSPVTTIEQVPPWPYSTVPDSIAWVGRCFEQLMLRDASLDRREARELATEMGTENWCRLLQPEAAADALFQTGNSDEFGT